MIDTELIMRRKAKRIKKASEMLRWLEFDIKQTDMSETDKLGLYHSIDTL